MYSKDGTEKWARQFVSNSEAPLAPPRAMEIQRVSSKKAKDLNHTSS
jgi:hypothetical protein